MGIKYQCPHCDYQATAKESLTAHKQSVHFGQKHPCPDCGKHFTQKRSITSHRQAVHLGIKYTCRVCNSQFTQKAKLKKHEQSKHSRNQTNKLLFLWTWVSSIHDDAFAILNLVKNQIKKKT